MVSSSFLLAADPVQSVCVAEFHFRSPPSGGFQGQVSDIEPPCAFVIDLKRRFNQPHGGLQTGLTA